MTSFKALTAAVLLNVGLGSFYAWSVFVAPFESLLGASRSEISVVFSVATVCFVAAMLFAALLHARLSASRLALISCGLAATGLGLAGWAVSLSVVIIGYGLLFGTANGLGYALAMQVVSRSFERRRAMALGVVIAAYAGGAVAAAPVLSRLIVHLGLSAALYLLAGTVLATGLVSAWLLRDSAPLNQPNEGDSRRAAAVPSASKWLFGQMWVAYALGASAGLMMIGHATGIIKAAGGSANAILLGPVLVSIGNGLGRIGAGWLGDSVPVRWVLSLATGIGAAALFANVVAPSAFTALTAVAATGAAYGILAVGYPIAVTRYFGAHKVAAVYGLLFTAWGVGGVFGPILAAEVFDLTGDYDAAILIACLAAAVATAITLFLPGHTDSDSPRSQS